MQITAHKLDDEFMAPSTTGYGQNTDAPSSPNRTNRPPDGDGPDLQADDVTVTEAPPDESTEEGRTATLEIKLSTTFTCTVPRDSNCPSIISVKARTPAPKGTTAQRRVLGPALHIAGARAWPTRHSNPARQSQSASTSISRTLFVPASTTEGLSFKTDTAGTNCTVPASMLNSCTSCLMVSDTEPVSNTAVSRKAQVPTAPVPVHTRGA